MDPYLLGGLIGLFVGVVAGTLTLLLSNRNWRASKLLNTAANSTLLTILVLLGFSYMLSSDAFFGLIAPALLSIEFCVLTAIMTIGIFGIDMPPA